MDKLQTLEYQSIFILREAYRSFKNLAMLWSIGKDSTVLLWLAKKAFLGHVPFELLHIDTAYKVPEMIAYRDKIARELKLRLVVGQNKEALATKQTFPDGNVDRIACCKNLKAIPLNHTLDGTWERRVYDPQSDSWRTLASAEPYNAVIVGVRSDEEGSRSKERVFSARDSRSEWDASAQPPELWNLYKTEFAPGTNGRSSTFGNTSSARRFRLSRFISTKGRARATARWAATHAPRPCNRTRRIPPKSSMSSQAASSRTLPSAAAGRKTKRAVARSRRCAKKAICRRVGKCTGFQ